MAIDTATSVCSAAIGEGGKVIAEKNVDAGRSQLELLLAGINNIMEAHSIDAGDLGGIIVGTGPGTFSGLRVGIATARGLSQALEIPIHGSSSLKALALGLSRRELGLNEVLPLIDAKRGQVFTQLFRKNNDGDLSEESKIFCLDPDDVNSCIGKITEKKVLAGGEGALVHYEILKRAERLELLPAGDTGHELRAALHLQKQICEIPAGDKLPEVMPVYVREPDADKTVLLRKREPWL